MDCSRGAHYFEPNVEGVWECIGCHTLRDRFGKPIKGKGSGHFKEKPRARHAK